MKKIGCLRNTHFGLIRIALAGLAMCGLSAQAQITTTPAVSPPFTGSGTSTITTITTGGTFNGILVQSAAGATGTGTVTLGPGTVGTPLNLNGAAPTEIGLTVPSTVTLLPQVLVRDTATTANSSAIMLSSGTVTLTDDTDEVLNSAAVGGENAIKITGAGTVMNGGGIISTAPGANDGVLIGGGGSVTNSGTGLIEADGTAIKISGGTAGSVTNTSTNGSSIHGNTGSGVDIEVAGTVMNSGSITTGNGGMDGVLLNAGGTVANTGATAVIGGNTNGVLIANGTGTVTNSGSITGTTLQGVSLTGGGSVTDSGNGTITGGVNGILINGAAGATGLVIDNSAANNSIQGGTGAGVDIEVAGTVMNSGGAIVTGNTGTDGVLLNSGGTVTNLGADGLIAGHTNGVDIENATGTVTNTGGVIGGTTLQGVLLSAGGTVTNSSIGTIQGGVNGILINGAAGATGMVNNTSTANNSIMGTTGSGVDIEVAGTVMNTGTIVTGNGGMDGVLLDAGGTVTSTGAAALIGGNVNGVAIENGAGTVTNSGVITGSTAQGVLLSGGGTVTNSDGGSITGMINGILVQAATGTVINSSSITGTTGSGVALGAGGSVTSSVGSIRGNIFGIDIEGGTGTVVNSGGIQGNIGVQLGAGGSLTNNGNGLIEAMNGDGVKIVGAGMVMNNTGTISGATAGVEITGAGTVINTGRLAGTTAGILLDAGGTVSNTGQGDITASAFGVNVTGGNGTVTNSGTISARNNGGGTSGVLLQAGGTVNNLAGGSIDGDMTGVDITGGTAAGNLVSNAGTIQANNTGTDGVKLESGGTVNNMTQGSITGVTNGIDVTGGTGTVINAGTITGTNTNGVFLEAGGAVANSGSITSQTNGINIQNGTFATNSVSNSATGTITGTLSNGIVLSTGSVGNAGTITGSSDGIVIANQAAVTNSGAIQASQEGILLSNAGANSSVVLQNGTIGAQGNFFPPINDVLIQNATATTTVTINGRTMLTSQGTDLVGGGGTLVLHLVGITAAQQAAISSANPNMATLTAGGETYTIAGFSAIVNQSVSLGSAVDSGLQDLGNKLDATGLPTNTTAYDVFYNAALLNPEEAVAKLSGRVLTQGVNDLEINSRSGLISDLGNQFDSMIESDNIGGIDLSHFSIGTSQMLAFTDTSSQLDSLVNIANCQIGGTEMSDSKRMAPVPAPISTAKWGVWASGTIQVADKDNSAGNTGFHAVNGSPSIGVDYRICPDLVVGALFSYTTAGADFNDGSQIESSTELGGLYGVYQHDGWRVHAVAAGGASQYDNSRSTFAGSATSSPNGTDVISDITGGYQFKLGDGGKLRVTPEAGVQYTHLQQDGFTESGPAAFAISRGSFDTDSLRTHVGFRSEYAFQVGQGLQFIPEIRAAWYHECLDDASGVSTSLTGAPALGSFSIRTFDPERDYALVGIGLNTAFTGYHGMPTGLFLNYDAQVGQSDFIQHNVSLGVRVAF